MTPEEGFSVGFLLHCADAGLSPAQVDERVQLAKLAADLQSGRDKRAGVGKLLSTGAFLTAAAAAGIPAVAYGLGGVTGRARANMASDASLDAEALKQKEILAELDRQIAMLETAAASRHRRLKLPKRISSRQVMSPSGRHV